METEEMPQFELAGMALRNGVMVLGPTSFGVAVREPDGSIRTSSGARPAFGERLANDTPMLRGPVKLLNMMAVLPVVRRAMPPARFGFESRGLLAASLAGGVIVRVARARVGGGAAGELVGGVVSLALTGLAMRGGEVAAYHGAEHKAIAGYEQGISAAQAHREHPRCGTQLALPMMAFSTAATQLATLLAPGRPASARMAGQLVGLAAATELFRSANRGGGGRLAAVAQRAGIGLQTHATTAEPTADQLEVAEAALAAVLTEEQRRAAEREAPPSDAPAADSLV